jgi:hypothetical protein
MTSRPPAARPVGAARFNPPAPVRAHSRLSTVGATIALLALVAGVPALLVLLAGPVTVPTAWPDRASVTGTIGIEQVITVLVVVVWLAWLQFLICVLVEVLAALRGGVLAARIPFSGPSQRLARTLVASVLLAGTIVAQVSTAQAAVTSSPVERADRPVASRAVAEAFGDDDVIVFTGDTPVKPAVVAPASARQLSARQLTARQAAAAEATARRAANHSGVHGADPASAAVGLPVTGAQNAAGISKDELALDGRKVYEVKAPAGRHHDSLWAIAERHLGDGRRYQEIYQLNEGRPQPDGRTLHLARLIQPGWRLVMPEDAVGVPRYVASATPSSAAPDSSTTNTPAQPNRTERSGPDARAEALPPLATLAPPSRVSPSARAAQSARPSQSVVGPVTSRPSRPAAQPSTARPTAQPSTARPSTDRPTARPTTEQPAPAQSAQPSASRPATARPSATRAPAEAGPVVIPQVGAPSAGAPSITPAPAAPPAASPPSTAAPRSSGATRSTAGTPAGAAAPAGPTSPARRPSSTGWPRDAGANRPSPPTERSKARPDSSVTETQPGENALASALHSKLAGAELLGAGLLAAALLGTLLAVRRRRGNSARPDPESIDTEVWLRAGADADRGALLDLALRSLPRSCREGGLPLPQAYGAVVDDDGLDLLLTMAHPSAPPPWTTTEEGLRWRLTYEDAQHLVAEGDSAYPLLASVGRDPQGRDALINLGAAAGPVAVIGSPAMAAAVVRALALGLAGNPWSRGIEVLTSDLPPALPAIAAGRLVPCAGARDLTDQLEQGSGRMPRTGPIQILTGGPAPGSRPERVAVFGAPLNSPTAQRLQAIVGRRTDLAVVVTGELPGACWRLKVDDSGNLNCDELSLSVTANRLGDGSIERLHSLFMSASTAGQRPGGLVSDLLPDQNRTVDTDDVTWAQAPVRVAILGDVEVRAPGDASALNVALASEIVAYLALHPTGAHPTVLASAVWPRGVTSDVRDATLEQVRSWLGTDQDGTPRLKDGRDGRIRLSPTVPCDWDVLRTLIARADTSTDQARERDLLVRGLHLVRGPLAGGITHGTYTWLPRTDLERLSEKLIVDAADRLSEICFSEGDSVAVERASAIGLVASPTAQHLWRHILRAEHALGGPPRLATATEHLRFTLTTTGTDLEPETQALIEHLTGVSAPS